MKKLKKSFFILLTVITFSTSSFAFEYKDIDSFKTLSDFEKVEEFETYYKIYTTECLDNGYGGTGSISCFVSSKLWDKELNIYYKKLMSKLNSNEKELLKKSQKKWLESRDLTIEFNTKLLDKIYTEEGTMYLLISAGDADSLISPIIRERALTLKRWYDLQNN